MSLEKQAVGVCKKEGPAIADPSISQVIVANESLSTD